uniref:hypothetical protein n=1 Tax=uncultured Altererythrobacter sp. TaxID=500840 RepID=UPI00262600D1|nr:hypothetical protein [uncultured Altererythrobacter sp.]
MNRKAIATVVLAPLIASIAMGFDDIRRKIQSGYYDPISEFGLMAQDSFGILPLGWAIGLAMTLVIGLPIGYAITFALTRMRFENLIIYSALGAAMCALIGKALFFDDRELMVAYITNGLVLGAGFWTFVRKPALVKAND